MRWRIFIGLGLFVASMLACSLAGGNTPTQPPPAIALPTATVPPVAPTSSSVPTFPTEPIIGVATPGLPVTTTGTLTTTLPTTATGTLTATVAATLPPPTVPPVSTGPLDFQVYLVGCRLDDSRAGGVILSFKVEATGGNGVYTYVREGQAVSQTSDRPATKGTAVVDAWRVTSSDGQTLEKKFQFRGSEFKCP